MKKNINYILLLTLSLCPLLLAADCVIPVPGDLNGDCIVDIHDFKILSKNWLKDGTLPQDLPILQVKNVGISESQSAALGEAFGVELLYGNSTTPQVFFNNDSFQIVPTTELQDQELIDRLIKENEVEEGVDTKMAFPVLNTEALLAIKPMEGPLALRKVQGTLGDLDLWPPQTVGEISHSSFEAFDIQGNAMFEPVMLDTSINVQTFINDIPVIGPGQQQNFSFSPEGKLTQMVLARRGIEPGDPVDLITPERAAAKLFISSNGTFIPSSDIKLCYYAPPLSTDTAQVLIPHYDIGGILYGQSDQEIAKLRRLVPAVAEDKLVPSVQLYVSVQDNYIIADTDYSGGAEPYSFHWFSSSVDLSEIPSYTTSVQYPAFPREDTETLTVQLIDANGIIVSSTQTVLVSAPATDTIAVTPAASYEPDFGAERGVGDLGAANQSGFVNRFQSEGIYKRFNWGATTAWEQDFKLKNGSTYIDQADIVFYVGHGWGGGFTFETTNDDSSLTYADAVGAWGGGDLEWLTLLSCEVLKETHGGKSWATRWGPTFNGLHLLCGFQTTAYDWHGFAGRFADWTLGRDLTFVHLPPIPVRSAWIQAKKEEQPSSVEAVVMGPVGPNGLLGGYYDYFWGKGSVSSDLRGNNIRGFWRIVYK